MLRRFAGLGFAVLAYLGLAAPAHARACPEAGCEATNGVSVHVGTFMRLNLLGTATVSATLAQAAGNSDYQESAGPTAVVRSNGVWKLQISVADAAWTPGDAGARADKPAGDLAWSTLPEGGFTSLTTTVQDVTTGTPTRGTTLPLFYRTRFDRTRDTPGTYSIVVRLSLVGA